ncbi:hypothetical protein MRB53_011277 [Persea americana]|uniref:Uncharacterized protein n=1 Tax=Persea americana TaxID=3435 RepID=A0ACC2LUH1_PERAE|nr:hypothetical protein MRB53_011277 [Persea americana]
MAAPETQPNDINSSSSIQVTSSPKRKHGGWITIPFILGSALGLGLANGGISANLVVYLIKRFRVKSIDAAQIYNIINGCVSVAPFAGAIISDSYLGCYMVIFISSIISLLSMILLTLTTIHPLRPLSCANGSKTCEAPTTLQVAVLYTGIALMTIGIGGTRVNVATMGANQFNNPKVQGSFFNWYFFVTFVASIAATVGLVYVEDNVGWVLGFGLCILFNAIGVVVFFLGRHYYQHHILEGSPFTGLARVMVAAIKKRNMRVSSESKDYCYGHDGMVGSAPPSSSLSFLNRAALKSGNGQLENPLARPWSLCTVEQVEDLKTIIKIIPLWSTSIFLSTPIATQVGLLVLQALSMDRHLGPHISIPAGSFLVFSLLPTAVSLPIVDRIIYPTWQKLTGRYPTALQRIGVGHIFTIISMVGFALLESRRLHAVHSHQLENQPNSVAPMSALWLVVPLAILGCGEAFHGPGSVAFYYQEFPKSVASTATAMATLVAGISFYLSTVIIGLMRRVTTWLPNNMNQSRLDNVYWVLTVVGVLNFGYFLSCTWLYKNQSLSEERDDTSSSS